MSQEYPVTVRATELKDGKISYTAFMNDMAYTQGITDRRTFTHVLKGIANVTKLIVEFV